MSAAVEVGLRDAAQSGDSRLTLWRRRRSRKRGAVAPDLRWRNLRARGIRLVCRGRSVFAPHVAVELLPESLREPLLLGRAHLSFQIRKSVILLLVHVMYHSPTDVLELVLELLAHGIEILELAHVGLGPGLLGVAGHGMRFMARVDQRRIDHRLLRIGMTR